jgi:hypothetical protein
MATKNDEVIIGLKKEIEEKKANLAKVNKFNPVTNCNLVLDGNRYNIHASDKETLLLLIGKVSSVKMGLNKELPEEKLIIGGYTADEWLKDLKDKFAILNVSLEESRLKSLEKKLHNLLSTDKKVELEIDDLKKQI